MSYRLITSAVILTGLTFTASVRAGDWVTVATACSPDESSVGKFQADFGRFQFLGANVGSIDARCNVTNPQDFGESPGWAAMEVTYEDPDGFFTDSQVVVTLRRVDKFTGQSFLIATYDSNTQAAGQQLRTASFNHAFNFANNGYYVGISVRRSNATLTPRIQRVRLYIPPEG